MCNGKCLDLNLLLTAMNLYRDQFASPVPWASGVVEASLMLLCKTLKIVSYASDVIFDSCTYNVLKTYNDNYSRNTLLLKNLLCSHPYKKKLREIFPMISQKTASHQVAGKWNIYVIRKYLIILINDHIICLT